MTKADFIRIIEASVRAPAIGALDVVRDPPGRKPAADLVEASHWFNRLSEHDQKMVQWVVRHVADAAVFHFLCVLDGVAGRGDGEAGGELRLYHVTETEQVLLNADEGNYLHELYDPQSQE
jgi:hypothetical protein